MQPVVRPLLVLHSDDVLWEALRDGPGQLYNPSIIADWDALRNALWRAPLTSIAVVNPWAGPGQLAEELRAILTDFPSATVIAALHVAPGDSEILTTLIKWGVADFIVLGHEATTAGLSRRLRLVHTRAVEGLLHRALPGRIPSRKEAILVRAAEVVTIGGGAPEFAAALRVSKRTVPRWCERADLPPPRRLLTWLRLLMAAELLEHPDRSIASVARACGYATEASLKMAFKQLLRVNLTELRHSEPFATVAKAFADDQDAVRGAAPGRVKSANVWLN